jgi:hypothetical protein
LLESIGSPEDVAMTQASWVGLIEHAFWPVAVIVLAVVLRRQIGDFLSAVGGRITRVSVMSVTIELAMATETVPRWQGFGGDDVRGLVAAQMVNDSYFGTLRQSLLDPGTADFFVVDLKSDGRNEWLTSRLYLFTYVLSRMKGVRCIVFTATRGDMARSFLGVAEAKELMHTLATAEPSLRLARLQVEADQVGILPAQPTPAQQPAAWVPLDINEQWQSGAADPLRIAEQFLQHIQFVQPPGAPGPEVGWLQLSGTPGPDKTWEHATWITASDLTDGTLRDVVQPDGYVLDDRSWSAEERVRSIARARGDFVALLGPGRRFEHLVDRRSLLEALGTATANQ